MCFGVTVRDLKTIRHPGLLWYGRPWRHMIAAFYSEKGDHFIMEKSTEKHLSKGQRRAGKHSFAFCSKHRRFGLCEGFFLCIKIYGIS